jgi:hypothetical protein
MISSLFAVCQADGKDHKMIERAIHIVDLYTVRTNMSGDMRILGLLGFLVEKKPAADPAAIIDHFLTFMEQARFTNAQGVTLLCCMVDSFNDDDGFRRFFAEFAGAYTDSLQCPASGCSLSPADPQCTMLSSTLQPSAPTGASCAPLAPDQPVPASIPAPAQAAPASLSPAVTAVPANLSPPTPAHAVPAPPYPPPPSPRPAWARLTALPIDVPIPVTVTDYQQVTAWLTRNGPRPAEPGEILAGFQIALGDAVAKMELVVGPAGPALDASITRGKRFWTARPVYRIDEPSVIKVEEKTYHLRLACRV